MNPNTTSAATRQHPMTSPVAVDTRGDAVSGADAVALGAYERAAASFLHWRDGAEAPLAAALAASPSFTMAHVLAAWMHIGGRDPAGARRARPHVEQATALGGNARERGHVAALRALLGDDLDGARRHLTALLHDAPLDALALQMAHSFDHLLGDESALLRRVEAVLPAWSAALPGYAAVQAMHAFALAENGDHAGAQHAVGQALAIDPLEPRAHHAMAHVFEMTGRPDAGIAWVRERIAAWGSGTAVSRHLWWHVTLFELARGRIDAAIAIYDQRIRGGRAIADLIDAASLLWRVMLLGGATGQRFAELAGAWEPHIRDRYCTFSDLHAMLAFVGARRQRLAGALERVVVDAAADPSRRYGATSALIGVPLCRALIAFGRGEDAAAASLLARLPRQAHRIGGSQAQRDLLRLTQTRASQRVVERDRTGSVERFTPWLRPGSVAAGA